MVVAPEVVDDTAVVLAVVLPVVTIGFRSGHAIVPLAVVVAKVML